MGTLLTMHRYALGSLAALAGAVSLAIAGCGGPSWPLSTSPLTTADGAHVAVAGRGDLKTAEFDLAGGITTLTIRSGDIGTALYRIVTPAGSGVMPAVVVSNGIVGTQLASSGTRGPAVVDATLSSSVAWFIHLDGGGAQASVDMRAGGLSGLDVGAGVSRLDVTLPPAAGTLTVRMAGGASVFAVHAPAGEPARVALAGGGGSATVDGSRYTGIAGGTVYTPASWAGAVRRIDIDNTAGVSTFSLDRYEPTATEP